MICQGIRSTFDREIIAKGPTPIPGKKTLAIAKAFLPTFRKPVYNKVMKLFSLATLVLTTSSAFASFELLLLPTTTGRVQRIDPENGVALGSYAGGSGPLTFAATSSEPGLSYTGNNSGTMYVQEYSSGSLMPSSSYGGVTAFSDYTNRNATVFLTGTTIRIANRATLSPIQTISGALSAGVTWRTGRVVGDRYYLMGVSATNTVAWQIIDLVNGTSIGAGTYGTTVSNVGSLVGAFSGSSAYWTQNEAGTIKIMRASLGSTSFGGASEEATLSFYASGPSEVPTLVRGHSSFYAIGRSAATATTLKVTQFDPNFNAYNTYDMAGMNPIARPVSGIVVAPEPMSMVALGIGTLALMRRRKVRNS